MSKKYNEPIRAWGEAENPCSFVWRGKFYRVNRVLQVWQVRRGLWQQREDRTHVLVEASCTSNIGTYELYFEHIRKSWLMAKVVD